MKPAIRITKVEAAVAGLVAAQLEAAGLAGGRDLQETLEQEPFAALGAAAGAPAR
jgi:hypothetical protein